MSFADKVRANPMISAAMAFALVVSSIGGVLTATGKVDSWIVTHAEHDADFIPLSENVTEIRAWQKCDRLERRIEALEDRKWKYEQAENPDPELIRDIENDIEDVREDYDANDCAKVLAA